MVEGVIAYDLDLHQFEMISLPERKKRFLEVGDTVEVLIDNVWTIVHLESGGYLGRYFILPDGQFIRPALCMKVRFNL